MCVDALVAGEQFMVRFSAKSKDKIGNHEGSYLAIERFARPRLLHFANAGPLKLSPESVGV